MKRTKKLKDDILVHLNYKGGKFEQKQEEGSGDGKDVKVSEHPQPTVIQSIPFPVFFADPHF